MTLLGGFIDQQRNAVLVGGTGTGKSHLAIAIARNCIRSGARGRFYNVVDLVNRLETEARSGRQGRIADHLTRLDFIVLDEARRETRRASDHRQPLGTRDRPDAGADGTPANAAGADEAQDGA